MPDDIRISNSLQDYLEAILNLGEENKTVRVTDLAVHLQVAKPSVTETVKTLAAFGLLKYTKYGPLVLTKKGREKAVRIRHRHEVLKTFLTDILGVDQETADREACLMEHAISRDTTDRLVRFLETQLNRNLYYSRKWIERKCPALETQTLSKLLPGQKAKVYKIQGTGAVQRRLVDMGIVPGTVLEMERFAPLGDPLEVKITGCHLSLRKEEADLVEIIIER